MKVRLFWKILFAFWITFLAITQGVWLLFEANRLRHAGPEVAVMRQAGQVFLSAGATLVQTRGTAAYDRFVATLPPPERDRMQRLDQPPVADQGN
jgi:two-component system OmpR family sensor kinase